MFLPGNYSAAVTMMLVGMFFWGSWPNTYKLTKDWRFELFYWDYAAGIFLSAIVVGLTLGTFGGGAETFWQNLHSADSAAWGYALVAGALWNFGNILLVAGVAMVGLAIAFPVSIGLALVVGAIGSYIVTPRGNPVFLFAGVLMVFLAVVVNSMAYRAASAARPKGLKGGLWVCLISGILFSGFGPLLAKALSSSHPLSPYGLNTLFTLGALVTTVPGIGYFMRRPVVGPTLSLADYRNGSAGQHIAGLLGGLFWDLGTTCTFVPMAMVGTALAYAIGQSNPLVAALWGVFVWKEFRGAPRKSQVLVGVMFILYVAGLFLMTSSFKSS